MYSLSLSCFVVFFYFVDYSNGVCLPGMFQCVSDGKCITQRSVCNSVPDCADRSDEPPTCSNCLRNQFQCPDKKCIPQSSICNIVKDCADGSDEPPTCVGGCSVNGTIIPQNTTVQDLEWWYVCVKTKWELSGCVVHGHRFRANEDYRMFTTEGIFWGKCQQLKDGFFLRQPQGCVDARGVNVKPGDTFMINDVFWGVCQLKQNTSTVDQVGQVTLNEVSWKVTGCNNGSTTPLKEGDEFAWIFDPYDVLGVKVKCRIPTNDKVFPTLNPTACIVGVNVSNAWEVRILKDHCYMPADDLLFYCSIIATSPFAAATRQQQQQSGPGKSFNLNITNNNPSEIQRLSQNKYQQCFEKDPTLTNIANAPKPKQAKSPSASSPNNQNPPPHRKRRGVRNYYVDLKKIYKSFDGFSKRVESRLSTGAQFKQF